MNIRFLILLVAFAAFVTAAAVSSGCGEQVFAARCHQCHPGGAGGLGPAINDKPLPVALMKTQVREGLGAMPAFSQAEINDDELEDVIRYLKALRTLRSPRASG